MARETKSTLQRAKLAESETSNEGSSQIRLRSGSAAPGWLPELDAALGWLAYRPSAAWIYVLAIGLSYLSCVVLFPQEVFSVRDESNYVGVAEAILSYRGLDIIRPEAMDGWVPWVMERNGATMPQHPMGMSFIAIPFLAMFGWKSLYFVSVAAFFLGAWFFSKILRRYQISPAYLLFYFAFPPLVLYSRFYMADVMSVSLCLSGFYFLRVREPGRRDGFLGMASLGLGFLVRGTNAFFIGPLAAYAVVRAIRHRDWPLLAILTVTGAGFLAAQLGLNTYYLETPLAATYPIGQMFGVKYFPVNIVFYTKAIALVFPLMILGLWGAFRERRVLELVIILSGIVFYSLYCYIDRDANPFVGLIRGQRFLLPYVALLLVFYVKMLQGVDWVDRWFHRAFLPLLVLPLIGIFILSRAHARFDAPWVEAKQWIYEQSSPAPNEAILYNIDSSEFVHGAFGERNYVMIRSGDEFDSAFARASLRFDRIVVVETDHKTRKGRTYVEAILAGTVPSGFSVERQFTVARVQVVVLAGTR